MRVETPEQVQAMNVLYEKMWLYYNFFQPVMYLQEKICLQEKVLRHWDQAQTPYERLIATGLLSSEQHAHLQMLYEQTNLMAIRKDIYHLLATLWEGPTALTRAA